MLKYLTISFFLLLAALVTHRLLLLRPTLHSALALVLSRQQFRVVVLDGLRRHQIAAYHFRLVDVRLLGQMDAGIRVAHV